MGNKTSPELTLSFLLLAAFGLEAYIYSGIWYDGPNTIDWNGARQYCQENFVDIVTWELVESSGIWSGAQNLNKVWMGVVRDPEEESVWRGINLITGEGTSGPDLSESIYWAAGQPINHCAAVTDDLTWNSTECSSENFFYCSVGGTIIHYTTKLSWQNASLYCGTTSLWLGNLATITKTNANNFTKRGWIGLYREGGDTWSWIGDTQSDYRDWGERQPVTSDCASFNPHTRRWKSNVCTHDLPFACIYDNVVVVNENKTWEDALSYCRNIGCDESSERCQYTHDLLSLEDMEEYNYARGRIYNAPANEFWIGLRFLGGKWWWMDENNPNDLGILPDCPAEQTHCGAISKNSTDNWLIRDCSEKRYFICAGV